MRNRISSVIAQAMASFSALILGLTAAQVLGPESLGIFSFTLLFATACAGLVRATGVEASAISSGTTLALNLRSASRGGTVALVAAFIIAAIVHSVQITESISLMTAATSAMVIGVHSICDARRHALLIYSAGNLALRTELVGLFCFSSIALFASTRISSLEQFTWAWFGALILYAIAGQLLIVRRLKDEATRRSASYRNGSSKRVLRIQLGTDFLLSIGASSVVQFAVLSASNLSAVGELRIGLLLAGSVAFLYTLIPTLTLGRLLQSNTRTRRVILIGVARCAALLIIVSLLLLLVSASAPPALAYYILGASGPGGLQFLKPLAIGYVFFSFIVSAQVALKLLRSGSMLLTGQILFSLGTITGAISGSRIGALEAVWGSVAGNVIGAIALTIAAIIAIRDPNRVNA